MDDPLIGSTLGSYQVISHIAQGGMARIYLALQPSLNRHIALKVLLPQFTLEQEFLQRFRREALSAARLNHPNIVHVYDAGEEHGYHYIAMEFVDGGTLEDRLEAAPGQPLPPDFILSVMDQVCAALDYAHANGVVHRDIKPSNILLKQDGRAVLSDFGIAKAFEGTQWVKTMSIIGTPEYMSPEQAQGQAVDHRTDIYSLGVILYQMLTGRVPFQAETPWAVIHQHIYEPLPPIQQVNPGVPAPLAQVVHQALDKEPGRRYARAGDLAMAVRSTMPHELPSLAREAVTSAPVSMPSPSSPPAVTPLGAATDILLPGARPQAPEVPITPPPVAEKPPVAPTTRPRRRSRVFPLLAGGVTLGGLLCCLTLSGVGAAAAVFGLGGFWSPVTRETSPTSIEATVTEVQPTASNKPGIVPAVTETPSPTTRAQTPAVTVTAVPTRTVSKPTITPTIIKATAMVTRTATATPRPTQPPPPTSPPPPPTSPPPPPPPTSPPPPPPTSPPPPPPTSPPPPPPTSPPPPPPTAPPPPPP